MIHGPVRSESQAMVMEGHCGLNYVRAKSCESEQRQHIKPSSCSREYVTHSKGKRWKLSLKHLLSLGAGDGILGMPSKGSTAESGPQLTLALGVLLPVSTPVDVRCETDTWKGRRFRIKVWT